jgi:hypothetical protein
MADDSLGLGAYSKKSTRKTKYTTKGRLWHYYRSKLINLEEVINFRIWDLHSSYYEVCRLLGCVCRSCVNRNFGGKYRLHLQGTKSVSEEPAWADGIWLYSWLFSRWRGRVQQFCPTWFRTTHWPWGCREHDPLGHMCPHCPRSCNYGCLQHHECVKGVLIWDNITEWLCFHAVLTCHGAVLPSI